MVNLKSYALSIAANVHYMLESEFLNVHIKYGNTIPSKGEMILYFTVCIKYRKLVNFLNHKDTECQPYGGKESQMLVACP